MIAGPFVYVLGPCRQLRGDPLSIVIIRLKRCRRLEPMSKPPASTNANPNSTVWKSGIPVKGSTATGGLAGGLVNVTPSTAFGGVVQTVGAGVAGNVQDVVEPAANVKPDIGAAVIVVREPATTARLPVASTVAPLK